MTITKNPNVAHTNRVRQELDEAGLSALAVHRFTGRYLPKIIHKDEHIHAAVFGHRKTGPGLLDFMDGMIVATDNRIIYLDHSLGFTTMDEISYDVVSGVNTTQTGITNSLTLFTKLGHYTISFARQSSVERFANYVESRRIGGPTSARFIEHTTPVIPLQSEAAKFLSSHNVAVLSTASPAGDITGATIYYTLLDDIIYILTRNGTRKAHNVFSNPQVALTIYDATHLQELQLEGAAHVETDSSVTAKVLAALLPPAHTTETKKLSLLTKIQSGAFVVFRITPASYHFSDYG